jgi:hypothetical protein
MSTDAVGKNHAVTDTQTLTIRCTGCGAEVDVASRSQFGIVEDLHREACNIDALEYAGTVDTLLALPPFEHSGPPETSAAIRLDLNEL